MQKIILELEVDEKTAAAYRNAPPEKQERAKERARESMQRVLFDAQRRRRRVKGLAIAQWAVRLCGGRIELESQEGEGSTFHMVLPGVPPAASQRR